MIMITHPFCYNPLWSVNKVNDIECTYAHLFSFHGKPTQSGNTPNFEENQLLSIYIPSLP